MNHKIIYDNNIFLDNYLKIKVINRYWNLLEYNSLLKENVGKGWGYSKCISCLLIINKLLFHELK